MGSAVATLSRYTKTIVEFQYKRRNVEKNMRIKQKLLELDLPEQMWDMYLTAVPAGTEAHLDLPDTVPVNGRKPPSGTKYMVGLDNVPDLYLGRQGEE